MSKQSEITALHDRWMSPIFRSFKSSLDEADALDLTQDTFVKALVAIHKGRGPSSPSHERAWLFAIAHHVLIDFLRKKRRHTTCRLSEAAEPGTEADAVPAELRLRETLRIMDCCGKETTVRTLEMLLQGKSIEEIAKQLDRRVATIIKHRTMICRRIRESTQLA